MMSAESGRAPSASSVARVLTLHIRPEAAHQYQARVFDGRVLVGQPTLHPGIAQAIEAYGQTDDFGDVRAFDIWYGGSSVGPVARASMRSKAPELAQRLTILAAVLR